MSLIAFFVLTFLAQHTRFSVIIATLFHGTVNTFGFFNTAADAEMRGWGNAIAYGIAAIAILAASPMVRRSKGPKVPGAYVHGGQ